MAAGVYAQSGKISGTIADSSIRAAGGEKSYALYAGAEGSSIAIDNSTISGDVDLTSSATLNFTGGTSSVEGKIDGVGKINVNGQADASFGNYQNAKLSVSGRASASVNNAAYSDNNSAQDASYTPLVYAQLGTLEISGSSFSNNTADFGTSQGGSGAGAIVAQDANVSISSSDFTGNSAVSEASGNVYFTAGTAISSVGNSSVSISDSNFISNRVVTDACAQGVVYTASTNTNPSVSATLNVSGSTFDSNVVSGMEGTGGAISAWWQNDVDIKSSTFSNNQANSSAEGGTARGGAIYVDTYESGLSTTLDVSNSEFVGNSANGLNSGLGSAVALARGANQSIKATFTDTLFSGNSLSASASSVADGALGGGAVGSRRADVEFAVTNNLLYSGNSVSLAGSLKDENGGFLYLFSDESGSASANFDIANGATLTIGDGRQGYDSIASNNAGAAISKSGAGALTVNGSMEYFKGSLSVNEGTLNANNKLGASSISIAEGASLGLKIAGDNALSGENLALSNKGTIILTAAAGLSAGDYSISSSAISDYGATKTYGGNLVNGSFVVEAAKEISLDTVGESVSVSSNGRAVLSDGSALVEMAFNSESATINSAKTATQSLIDLLGSDFEAISAYDFDVAIDSGGTVVLSFLVANSSLSLEDFTIYQRSEGGEWTEASGVENLAYDGEYLSFMVSDLQGYGYAAVPEPATCAAILGAIAMALALYRKRK